MRTKKRNRRTLGCAKWLTALLILGLLVAVLFCTGVLTTLENEVEKRIYPIDHREIIEQCAERYDLDPAFICAVVYTESKFDADASSHAGAMGLMQLMPSTYEWLVDIRGESHKADDILTPEVNIDYGTYYLRYLIDKYSDEYTAAAAYNAGNIVSDWICDSRYSSDGITLSAIPYPETSGYVDKVADARAMYQKLYFDK